VGVAAGTYRRRVRRCRYRVLAAQAKVGSVRSEAGLKTAGKSLFLSGAFRAKCLNARGRRMVVEEEQFSKFLYAYYFITITIVISNRVIGFRKLLKVLLLHHSASGARLLCLNRPLQKTLLGR
jgi:hypothetical protein